MTVFCKNLTSLCQIADISIEDALRNACGEPCATLADDIVRNGYIPKTHVIERLAKFFEVGIDSLIPDAVATMHDRNVYIAGPVTGHPEHMWNFQAASAYMSSQGYHPFNPAAISKLLPEPYLSRQDYMELGLKLLSMCKNIALIPGWEKSSGCRMEAAYAEANGLHVVHLLPEHIELGKKLLKERN